MGCTVVEAGGLDVAAAEEEWKGEEVVLVVELEEEEPKEACWWAWTSLLMGETAPVLTDMAGEMSFRPKLSRLLDTLLILSGAGRGGTPEAELKGRKGEGSHHCWKRFDVNCTTQDRYCHIYLTIYSCSSPPLALSIGQFASYQLCPLGGTAV